jgi:hypothetical protein
MKIDEAGTLSSIFLSQSEVEEIKWFRDHAFRFPH